MPVNYTEDPLARWNGYDFRLAARHGARLISTIVQDWPDESLVLSFNYPASPAGAA